MTTPTRDEVVRLAAAAGSEPAYYGIHETVGRKFYCLADLEAFYNLARADLEATIAEQAAELESLQCKIDALMLEYCPDEMTEEQKVEWARHQQPVSDEKQRAVDAAIAAAPKQEK